MEENKKYDCNCDCGFFPRCPKCKEGRLLPFSFKEDVFEKWKCSDPDCGFVLRKNP